MNPMSLYLILAPSRTPVILKDKNIYVYLCPTEEESGMLMLSLSIKCSHGRWEGGKGDVWGQAD
jgi:hypothetical protein